MPTISDDVNDRSDEENAPPLISLSHPARRNTVNDGTSAQRQISQAGPSTETAETSAATMDNGETEETPTAKTKTTHKPLTRKKSMDTGSSEPDHEAIAMIGAKRRPSGTENAADQRSRTEWNAGVVARHIWELQDANDEAVVNYETVLNLIADINSRIKDCTVTALSNAELANMPVVLELTQQANRALALAKTANGVATSNRREINDHTLKLDEQSNALRQTTSTGMMEEAGKEIMSRVTEALNSFERRIVDEIPSWIATHHAPPLIAPPDREQTQLRAHQPRETRPFLPPMTDSYMHYRHPF